MLSKRKLVIGLVALALLGGLAVMAMAVQTADQTVSLTVQAINHVAVSGNVTFDISALDEDIPNSSTTLTYKTNSASNKKITATLGALEVSLHIEYLKLQVADSGKDPQALTPLTPVDVVTGITKTSQTKTMTYTVKVQPATVQGSYSVEVTFTITNQ